MKEMTHQRKSSDISEPQEYVHTLYLGIIYPIQYFGKLFLGKARIARGYSVHHLFMFLIF